MNAPFSDLREMKALIGYTKDDVWLNFQENKQTPSLKRVEQKATDLLTNAGEEITHMLLQ